MSASKKRMLFVLEGNTDIRFVSGLSEYFDLSIIGPTNQLHKAGGLKDRLDDLGLNIPVYEISGGRLSYQYHSFLKLLNLSSQVDFFFTQENLRGTLSAGLAGLFTRTPVFSHSGMPPREYFRCRYKRGQISWIKYFLGDSVIRILLTLNSWLCDFWFVLGPFLYEVFSPYTRKIGLAHYYGVDTDLYVPVEESEKEKIRKELGFSPEDIVIFFSSRVSHEKDPETVLKAVADIYKNHNSNILLMNLSGGHEQMRALSKEMGLENDENWLITKPPAHPMKDLPRYYQAADLVIQSSLEEGLGLSPLEAMSCEIPLIATDVGGMKAHLHPYAEMVSLSDSEAMKAAILKVIKTYKENPSDESRSFLKKGREYIVKDWGRKLAFQSLSENLNMLLLGQKPVDTPDNTKRQA